MKGTTNPLDIRITRLGVALEPAGDLEAEGTLNPAATLDREGNLLLYPRDVARGNQSRVGIVRVDYKEGDAIELKRLGFALEPQAPYEIKGAGGEGCEDPRVTYIAALGLYLIAYTGYSSAGPRIAIAYSHDGYTWHRVGTVEFPRRLKLHPDDKDAAFFPEPVLSPRGVLSIAMYHRPMVPTPMTAGADEIQSVLANAARARQSIRIAYTPLEEVLKDINALTRPTESRLVMAPSSDWGSVKVGGGAAPVRIKEGWLSVYHGVDAIPKPGGGYQMRYSAGLVIHDARQPHRIVYRSKAPILVPSTKEELEGTVNCVVFPTAVVPRSDLGERVFDVYYGMADFKIGRFRLELANVLPERMWRSDRRGSGKKAPRTRK